MRLRPTNYEKELKKTQNKGLYNKKLKIAGVVGVIIGTALIYTTYAFFNYNSNRVLGFNSNVNKDINIIVKIVKNSIDSSSLGENPVYAETKYNVAADIKLNPDSEYVYQNVSCTNNANSNYNENTNILKVSNIKQDTVCTINFEKNYIGYYADTDSDGTADGIIYADLAINKSGKWNNNSSSNYGWSKSTDTLKKYTIAQKSYKSSKFGNYTAPMIQLASNTNGKNRFYIMALEDMNEGTKYYWYKEAQLGELDMNRIESYQSNDFGKGKDSTIYWVSSCTYIIVGSVKGKCNPTDMWYPLCYYRSSQPIATEATGDTAHDDGWFVPSKSEWAAFGDMCWTNVKMTSSNYSQYGLSAYYWTSTIQSSTLANDVFFNSGQISAATFGQHQMPIRLSRMF